MFGYITADGSQLQEEQCCRYSGCYCGLCRALQRRHGFLGRMTLTYDMTFLVLVLSSLYEPEEQQAMGRCPVHPLKKRPYWANEFTDYAADLNLLLAWWNLLDDWEDEKKVSRLLLYKLLSPRCRRLEHRYPRQSQAIRENLSLLHRYEAGPEVSADRAANCFGDLMGELFVVRESDYWAATLREMGQGLGRFIYIMDACLDAKSDEKKGRPNPLLALGGQRDREGDLALLSMLLSDCTVAFERLPMVQDMDLMRNILYSGVWQKYNQTFHRRDKHIDRERDGEGETQL
jgi:hypothetical protein